MKKIITLLIIITLSRVLYSQSSPEPNRKENKQSYQTCIEIPITFLTDSNYNSLLHLTKEMVLKYKIYEIRACCNQIYNFIDSQDFSLIKTSENREWVNKLRSEIEWFKKNDVKITLYMGGEPSLPNIAFTHDEKPFFDVYPDAKYLDNGLLWKFLEDRTYKIFQLVPEADAFSFHLWETPLLNDLNYFSELRWQKDIRWHLGPNQYYSHTDYLI